MIRDLRTVLVDRRLLFQVAAEAAAPLALVWIGATPAEHMVGGPLKVMPLTVQETSDVLAFPRW